MGGDVTLIIGIVNSSSVVKQTSGAKKSRVLEYLDPGPPGYFLLGKD